MQRIIHSNSAAAILAARQGGGRESFVSKEISTMQRILSLSLLLVVLIWCIADPLPAEEINRPHEVSVTLTPPAAEGDWSHPVCLLSIDEKGIPICNRDARIGETVRLDYWPGPEYRIVCVPRAGQPDRGPLASVSGEVVLHTENKPNELALSFPAVKPVKFTVRIAEPDGKPLSNQVLVDCITYGSMSITDFLRPKDTGEFVFYGYPDHKYVIKVFLHYSANEQYTSKILAADGTKKEVSFAWKIERKNVQLRFFDVSGGQRTAFQGIEKLFIHGGRFGASCSLKENEIDLSLTQDHFIGAKELQINVSDPLLRDYGVVKTDQIDEKGRIDLTKELKTVDVLLARKPVTTGTFVLRTTDAETGEPVMAATLFSPMEQMSGKGVSTIRLKPGVYSTFTFGENYKPVTFDNLIIKLGETMEKEVKLLRAPTYRVRLETPDGTPLPKARIRFAYRKAPHVDIPFPIPNPEPGLYTVACDPDWDPILIAMASPYPTTVLRLGTEREVTLRLDAGRLVRVSFRFPANLPERKNVTITWSTPEILYGTNHMGGLAECAEDETGEFRLRPGIHRMVLCITWKDTGKRDGVFLLPDITVEEGTEPLDWGTIELTEADLAKHVSGEEAMKHIHGDR